jgi:hypothetical protein
MTHHSTPLSIVATQAPREEILAHRFGNQTTMDGFWGLPSESHKFVLNCKFVYHSICTCCFSTKVRYRLLWLVFTSFSNCITSSGCKFRILGSDFTYEGILQKCFQDEYNPKSHLSPIAIDMRLDRADLISGNVTATHRYDFYSRPNHFCYYFFSEPKIHIKN